MTIPLYEDIESDEDIGDDYDAFPEASRTRPLRTARPAQMPSRPSGTPVTQNQFNMAIAELRRNITQNSTAIQRVNTSVTAVGRDMARVRKDAADRRKDITGIKKTLGQTADTVMMLPLLQQSLGANNQLTELLPFLLLSGIDTGSGSDGSGGMFGNNMMMMLLLVLTLGKSS